MRFVGALRLDGLGSGGSGVSDGEGRMGGRGWDQKGQRLLCNNEKARQWQNHCRQSLKMHSSDHLAMYKKSTQTPPISLAALHETYMMARVDYAEAIDCPQSSFPALDMNTKHPHSHYYTDLTSSA